MKLLNKNPQIYPYILTALWCRSWHAVIDIQVDFFKMVGMNDANAGSSGGAGNGRSSGKGSSKAGASDGGDMDDMEPVTPRSPVGSGTDPVASGDLGNMQHNVTGGTTSGGLNTDSTATGGAGAGSGAGDVNALSGMNRAGNLGSGTDDIRTTVQPGNVGSPMQANPGKGVSGGGAGAAYPDIDPAELGASPGQAKNITPSGKVIDPDEENER